MRQTIINTYLQTIGKTWEQVSSYERTVLSSFADELERKLTPTKKGVQLMSKNTTDELTTARLYDNRFNRFDDELINKYFNDEGKKSIEKYISNREKLARIDELREAARHADRMYPECDNVLDHIENRIDTLRKELDGEQS